MLEIYSYFGGRHLANIENAEDITITEEINGEYSLTFSLPLNDGKEKFIEENAIIKCTYNDQYYRIEKVTRNKSSSPSINVVCQHIINDGKKVVIPAFEAEIGQYSNAIFEKIWQETDFDVLSDEEISKIGMTQITTYTDLEKQDKQTPYDLTMSLIDVIGQGELYIDNNSIAFVNEIGAAYPPLLLSLTKNMDSITIDTDASTLVTRLYPFGKNNLDLSSLLGRLYIDSPNIDKYGVVEGVVDFSHIGDIEMLYERALWQYDELNQNRIDVPYVTISGKYIDMSSPGGNVSKPHLGQRVVVEGYSDKRIIKIVWKPQTPYDTEITIGQVKKDLFYFFKKFNDTTEKFDIEVKNITNSTEFNNTIVEVTKQEVVAADVIEASSAFVDDLQVERLETNVKAFICRPNLTKTNGVLSWAGDEHTFSATNTTNIRGFIRINGMTTEYIEAHLVEPADYGAMTLDEVQPLIVNGRQLYFTSVEGAQAFQYLTFTAPKAKYPSLLSDQAEMFVVCTRKTAAEYIKMTQNFEWSVTDGTYYVNTVYGTGDENGNGQYKFIKDGDSGRFVYTSRTDGLEYGITEKDDGTYQRYGGLDFKIPPMKTYDTLEAAESDKTLPIGGIAIIKGV